MHISEGVLSAPVLLTGYGIAAAGCSLGLKKLDLEKVVINRNDPLIGIIEKRKKELQENKHSHITRSGIRKSYINAGEHEYHKKRRQEKILVGRK